MLCDSKDVGARNERRLIAVVCGKDSGFEAVHGMLNRVMEVRAAQGVYAQMRYQLSG